MSETSNVQTNPSAGATPRPQHGHQPREISWFEAMASAWGKALDRQADRIVEQSDLVAEGDDNPGQVNELQAEAQRMSFLSNASHTSITTIGSALDTMARKQ